MAEKRAAAERKALLAKEASTGAATKTGIGSGGGRRRDDVDADDDDTEDGSKNAEILSDMSSDEDLGKCEMSTEI